MSLKSTVFKFAVTNITIVEQVAKKSFVIFCSVESIAAITGDIKQVMEKMPPIMPTLKMLAKISLCGCVNEYFVPTGKFGTMAENLFETS